MPDRERRRHFRGRDFGGPRIPVRHRAHDGAWQHGETLNIGSGGAFVIAATWPVGTAVQLAVQTTNKTEPLILSGVVRWATGDGSVDAVAAGETDPAGVGVQFLDLDLDVIIELNDHLARLAAAAGTATETGDGDDDDVELPATD